MNQCEARQTADQQSEVQNKFPFDEFHDNSENCKGDRVEDSENCGVGEDFCFDLIVAQLND